MSQQAVSMVVAKAVMDPKFRELLGKDADAAIKSIGAQLTPAEHNAITALKPHDWNSMTLQDINKRIGKIASWEVSKITS